MTAAQILANGRAAIDPVLRGAVARLDPRNRRIVEYHLGFTDAAGAPAAGSAGKGLRGTLALLSAGAVTGNALLTEPRGAAPAGELTPLADSAPLTDRAAGAVELVHQYSLLHDDIIDRDSTRRHRPTAWTVYGRAATLLAGDALAALAMGIVLSGDTDARPASDAQSARQEVRSAAVADSLTTATARMLAGQAADIAFEHTADVDLAECRQMVADKTGALIACAASIGALAAGADGPLVSDLARFGSHIGMAFQLVDDVMGIWGSPGRTGKPAGSDLRARKRSLPVVAALTAGGPHADRLAEIYSKPGGLAPGDVDAARAAVEGAGGKSWAQAEADRETDAALEILASAPIDDAVRAELHTIALMLARRDA